MMDSINNKNNKNGSILVDSENEETELFDDEDDEEEEEEEDAEEEEMEASNVEDLERYIIMNDLNSFSMNNIVNIEDGQMWNLFHQRRPSLPNEMKIMDNNHKNDSSNNNQKSAIRNEDEVQTKRNDQLLNKPNSNNNTINNIKRKRDHSAPVISKSLSNDPNTNSVSSLYKHTSSSTNNFRSASNDRIDHSAPDYSETKNKKQENSKKSLLFSDESKILLNSDYDFKELSEHFIQKSEEEINHLRLENASLKSLLNSLQSTMHKNNEDENEQILQRQVRTLQEELLRVKLQLEQSQFLRVNELKKNRANETKSNLSSQNSSLLQPSNKIDIKNVENSANLLSEISQLKASENVLKQNLEDERQLNRKLNEKIIELTKELHEYELNKNGVNAALTSSTNPSKVILTNSDNEALYYEILEKLKTQGFDNTSNYQDIVIALYQQSNNSLKQLNELLYYMKQLNINCNEPVQGIKKLFDEIKSYRNEISHLNNKIESLKLEMQFQQNEYTVQIRTLLEEKENMMNTFKKANHINNNYVVVNDGGDRAESSSLKVTYINKNNNDYDNDDSSNNENEIQQFDNSYNDHSENKQSYRSSVQVITTKTYAIPYNSDENDNNESGNDSNEPNTKITIKKNERLNSKNKNTSSNNNSTNNTSKNDDDTVKHEMKHQIELLENQVKETTEKNNLLIDQYEKNVQYLNEQIKFYKNESEQHKREFSDYKQKVKLKNSELKRKIEDYEKEIHETTKQFNKDQIEIERLKLDLAFKVEEIRKLQNDLEDFSDCKTKCNHLEDKLSLETRNGQLLQNKNLQLEQELLIITRNTNKHEDLASNNDKMIENLKDVIKEQMFAKTSSAIDIEEQKLRIHELQMKLAHEKLLKDSLEIKLKLVEQDNQNLRQTLLSNSRKFGNRSDKDAKNRIDEINELIEKAQINAQNIIASNPSLLTYLESK